jgi:hypothetical protein
MANPPIAEDEARGFMRGLDHWLFASHVVHTAQGHHEIGYESAFCDVSQHLLTDGGLTGKRTLSRESIAQWAAACDLVLDHGWPKAAVQIESSERWDLDLLAYDRPRSDPGRVALLAGEAKAQPSVLTRLIKEMGECGGSRPQVHRDYPKKTEHNKCLGVRRLLGQRDRIYFWGVAPGLRIGATAYQDGGRFALEITEQPPSRSFVASL